MYGLSFIPCDIDRGHLFSELLSRDQVHHFVGMARNSFEGEGGTTQALLLISQMQLAVRVSTAIHEALAYCFNK